MSQFRNNTVVKSSAGRRPGSVTCHPARAMYYGSQALDLRHKHRVFTEEPRDGNGLLPRNSFAGDGGARLGCGIAGVPQAPPSVRLTAFDFSERTVASRPAQPSSCDSAGHRGCRVTAGRVGRHFILGGLRGKTAEVNSVLVTVHPGLAMTCAYGE